VTPTAPDVASLEPEPLYAAPTRIDRTGRILAAVTVNGRGPYRFIVDTGANRSALSDHLVAELGLVPAESAEIYLHGVTGYAALPAVDVETLRVGDIEFKPGLLPVLSRPVFGGADGILGVEGLQDARIAVDFVGDRVEIFPSTSKRAAPGFLRISARMERGGLLIANGSVGRVPVRVILDTGAERTLGNEALHEALQARADRNVIENTVIGATEDVARGLSYRVSNVKIGEAKLNNLSVTFGALHVFKIWGLEDTPALLVGMDLIGTLQRFVVDYKRQELHLQVRDAPGKLPNVYKCGPMQCQTRVPQPGT
jgi:predicted aspartyl protease